MELSNSAVIANESVPPGGTMELSTSSLLPASAVTPIHDRTTLDPHAGVTPVHDRTTLAAGAPPVHDRTTIAAGAPPVHDRTTLDPRPAGSLPPSVPTGRPVTGPEVPPGTTGPSPIAAPTSTGPSPTIAGPSPIVAPTSTGPSPIIASTSSPDLSSGAPDRSLGIPPTRPTAGLPASEVRPIPRLPLSKKQLVIAGGGLVAALAVIIIIMSGGSKQAAPTAKPGPDSTIVEEPKGDPIPEVAERANALIESEDFGDAVAIVKRARKANPDSAQLAFVSGKANFGRLYWTEGIADFRDAIRLDDSYKENDELLKTVLKGFLTTPEPDDRIVAFMREIGPPLRPLLEETAESHPRKDRRARARAELNAHP
jgi:hypothetical protein